MLNKSIYGFKKDPWAWYIELTTVHLQIGFKKSLADASIFIYHRDNVTCYFLVYVNDIVIMSNDSNILQHSSKP